MDVTNSGRKTAKLLTDHFRCPEDLADFTVARDLSHDSGYFRLGSNIICYGQCSSGAPAESPAEILHDSREHVSRNGSSVHLPFDPVQIVDNLRCERYHTSKGVPAANNFVRNMYYLARPFLPVSLRRLLQKLYFRGWDKTPFPAWPVDRTIEDIFEQILVLSMKSKNVERLPFIWFWPEGARSCTMLTHDVETSAGVDHCPQLIDLTDSFGIKSSFQFVPEKRYPIPESLLKTIRQRGFEINVHDLNHDGHLFSARDQFLRRAERINCYARQFDALGFRSAVMYRNTDWYDAFDFSYDMSIPNVAHLDPQQGGCCTVLPFFIGKILELPVTTTQDYTLFHILNDYSIRLWKEQISLIRQKHGLVSFIIHPDYVIDEAPRRVYSELLQYLCQLRSQGETWIALPKEVANWWRLRSEMNLVKVQGSWHIEGKGRERARLAYAVLAKDRISYEFDPSS
jgi:hypothetical protein